MRQLKLLMGATVPLVVLAAGCNLFKTNDDENSQGRGAAAFDPYDGVNSGAIRLGLLSFNGCSVLANSEPVAKGTNVDIPYPETCESWDKFYAPTPKKPTEKMELLAGTEYFLNQLTLMDQTTNQHGTPAETLNWIRTESRFKDLDWGGVSVGRDEVVPEPFDLMGLLHFRKVHYGGANWMINKKSTFLVEVLDAAGTPRATVTYVRDEMLAENPISRHMKFAHMVFNVAAPDKPHDRTINAGNLIFGPPIYLSYARVDITGSANPFKTFTVPEELKNSEGAIRVTWSDLPNAPFYFPVSFVDPGATGEECFDDEGNPAVCSFGLDPQLEFTVPENGAFYEPGEDLRIRLRIRDSSGNLLHEPDSLPSFSDYRNNDANGLLYADSSATLFLWATEQFSSFKIAGPLQNMRPAYSMKDADFVKLPENNNLGASETSDHPGMKDVRTPSEISLTLPENAEPGTYVAFLKVHRQFMGERFSKTKSFTFQVGQEEKTTYPNRVGNCQICHRRVLSLDNLLHGQPVDHIEGCKACHTHTDGPAEVSPLISMFHGIHMTSEKYPADKRDCTVCHLTRESTLRPSIQVCKTCHPSIHSDEFFELEFGKDPQPDRFSNCAQACHVVNPPSRHILPAQ